MSLQLSVLIQINYYIALTNLEKQDPEYHMLLNKQFRSQTEVLVITKKNLVVFLIFVSEFRFLLIYIIA